MNKTNNKKAERKVRIKKVNKDFFQMKDVDGKMLTKGDTVSVLCNGIELVDMETLDDVTGVITDFKDDCAVVNGSLLKSGEVRRIRMKA